LADGPICNLLSEDEPLTNISTCEANVMYFFGQSEFWLQQDIPEICLEGFGA
jgi:hypothetical protein